MAKDKIKDQVSDNEEVNNAQGFAEGDVEPNCEGQSCDNVTDESFEENDNSAQLAEAEQEWKDKYMRLSAEFDNYRKRTLKEKMDLIATGGEDVIKSLLVVIDDLDRALTAMESAKDVDAVKEGVLLISQKLGDTMRGKGVNEIVSMGESLDTDLHEAIAKFPVEDDSKKGKIIDVVQKGYKLKDKVIRHAKVVVGE